MMNVKEKLQFLMSREYKAQMQNQNYGGEKKRLTAQFRPFFPWGGGRQMSRKSFKYKCPM